MGLESGNQEIREVVIRKQSKNEHIVEGARLLREKRIKVLTTNMVGLPGETLDNALETVQLNMVLKSQLRPGEHVSPVSGTAAGRIREAEGLSGQRLRHGEARGGGD